MPCRRVHPCESKAHCGSDSFHKNVITISPLYSDPYFVSFLFLRNLINPNYKKSISGYFQLQGLLDQDEDETTSAASENQSENVSEAGDSSMDVN